MSTSTWNLLSNPNTEITKMHRIQEADAQLHILWTLRNFDIENT